nr:PREDICTED: uncharacterized protein LOC105662632 isoform X2 [Megachile rotundata]XP_012142130.1 PREDICTED: uncharacterized protein LOC105662632 isoform X2 [Megachile rotundata]XP_012142131.1 PREDICTED: uncharacterized protein LOC105662632 isoform X2 [Megachile rotundata]
MTVFFSSPQDGEEKAATQRRFIAAQAEVRVQHAERKTDDSSLKKRTKHLSKYRDSILPSFWLLMIQTASSITSSTM